MAYRSLHNNTDTTNTIYESLLNGEDLIISHLVKMQKFMPSSNPLGSDNYSYYCSGPYDIAFKDGSADSYGAINPSQIYKANTVEDVGDIKEFSEARSSTTTVSLTTNSLGLSITANLSVEDTFVTGSGTTNFIDAGLKEGQLLEFTSETSASILNNVTARIVGFVNDGKRMKLDWLKGGVPVGSTEVADYTISVLSSEISAFILSAQESTSFTSYYNKEVYIYRQYSKASSPKTPIGEPFLLFKGIISGGTMTEDPAKKGNMVWTLTSHWGDFLRVAGRRGIPSQQRLLNAETLEQKSNPNEALDYITDKGFMHAETAVNVTANYLTPEKRFRVKKKKKWYGSSKQKVKTYTVQVPKDQKLNFNLQSDHLPVVYGVQRIESNTIWADILHPSIATNTHLFKANTLCEGPISGILDIIVEDQSLVCRNSRDRKDRYTGNNTTSSCQGRADFGGVVSAQPYLRDGYGSRGFTAFTTTGAENSNTIVMGSTNFSLIDIGDSITAKGVQEGVRVESIDTGTKTLTLTDRISVSSFSLIKFVHVMPTYINNTTNADYGFYGSTASSNTTDHNYMYGIQATYGLDRFHQLGDGSSANGKTRLEPHYMSDERGLFSPAHSQGWLLKTGQPNQSVDPFLYAMAAGSGGDGQSTITVSGIDAKTYFKVGKFYMVRTKDHANFFASFKVLAINSSTSVRVKTMRAPWVAVKIFGWQTFYTPIRYLNASSSSSITFAEIKLWKSGYKSFRRNRQGTFDAAFRNHKSITASFTPIASNTAPFAIQNEFFKDNTRFEYWGADHRLLDTAYVTTLQYKDNNEDGLGNESEYVVKGKLIDTHTYDLGYDIVTDTDTQPYRNDSVIADNVTNLPSFSEGDEVQLSAGSGGGSIQNLSSITSYETGGDTIYLLASVEDSPDTAGVKGTYIYKQLKSTGAISSERLYLGDNSDYLTDMWVNANGTTLYYCENGSKTGRGFFQSLTWIKDLPGAFQVGSPVTMHMLLYKDKLSADSYFEGGGVNANPDVGPQGIWGSVNNTGASQPDNKIYVYFASRHLNPLANDSSLVFNSPSYILAYDIADLEAAVAVGVGTTITIQTNILPTKITRSGGGNRLSTSPGNIIPQAASSMDGDSGTSSLFTVLDTGRREGSNDNLPDNNQNPRGIAVDNTHIYVCDWRAPAVLTGDTSTYFPATNFNVSDTRSCFAHDPALSSSRRATRHGDACIYAYAKNTGLLDQTKCIYPQELERRVVAKNTGLSSGTGVLTVKTAVNNSNTVILQGTYVPTAQSATALYGKHNDTEFVEFDIDNDNFIHSPTIQADKRLDLSDIEPAIQSVSSTGNEHTVTLSINVTLEANQAVVVGRYPFLYAPINPYDIAIHNNRMYILSKEDGEFRQDSENNPWFNDNIPGAHLSNVPEVHLYNMLEQRLVYGYAYVNDTDNPFYDHSTAVVDPYGIEVVDDKYVYLLANYFPGNQSPTWNYSFNESYVVQVPILNEIILTLGNNNFDFSGGFVGLEYSNGAGTKSGVNVAYDSVNNKVTLQTHDTWTTSDTIIASQDGNAAVPITAVETSIDHSSSTEQSFYFYRPNPTFMGQPMNPIYAETVTNSLKSNCFGLSALPGKETANTNNTPIFVTSYGTDLIKSNYTNATYDWSLGTPAPNTHPFLSGGNVAGLGVAAYGTKLFSITGHGSDWSKNLKRDRKTVQPNDSHIFKIVNSTINTSTYTSSGTMDTTAGSNAIELGRDRTRATRTGNSISTVSNQAAGATSFESESTLVLNLNVGSSFLANGNLCTITSNKVSPNIHSSTKSVGTLAQTTTQSNTVVYTKTSGALPSINRYLTFTGGSHTLPKGVGNEARIIASSGSGSTFTLTLDQPITCSADAPVLIGNRGLVTVSAPLPAMTTAGVNLNYRIRQPISYQYATHNQQAINFISGDQYEFPDNGNSLPYKGIAVENGLFAYYAGGSKLIGSHFNYSTTFDFLDPNGSFTLGTIKSIKKYRNYLGDLVSRVSFASPPPVDNSDELTATLSSDTSKKITMLTNSLYPTPFTTNTVDSVHTSGIDIKFTNDPSLSNTNGTPVTLSTGLLGLPEFITGATYENDQHKKIEYIKVKEPYVLPAVTDMDAWQSLTDLKSTDAAVLYTHSTMVSDLGGLNIPIVHTPEDISYEDWIDIGTFMYSYKEPGTVLSTTVDGAGLGAQDVIIPVASTTNIEIGSELICESIDLVESCVVTSIDAGVSVTVSRPTNISIGAGTAVSFSKARYWILVANLASDFYVRHKVMFNAYQTVYGFKFEDVIRLSSSGDKPNTLAAETIYIKSIANEKTERKIIAYDQRNRFIILNDLFISSQSDSYNIYPDLGRDLQASTNPCMQLLDYLTNPIYGKGLNLDTEIDLTSFKNAAKKCDATSAVTIVTQSTAPTIGEEFTCSYDDPSYPATAPRVVFRGTVGSVISREVYNETYHEVTFTDVAGKIVSKWNYGQDQWGKYMYYRGDLRYSLNASTDSIINTTTFKSKPLVPYGYINLKCTKALASGGTYALNALMNVDIGKPYYTLTTRHTQTRTASQISSNSSITILVDDFEDGLVSVGDFLTIDSYRGIVYGVDATAGAAHIDLNLSLGAGNVAYANDEVLTLTKPELDDQFITHDFNPVVKSFDSDATNFTYSGYSLYDSDSVVYYPYVGWEELKQSYVTRHQTNFALDTTNTLFDNVNLMLQQFNGILTYSGGKYRLNIETRQPETQTLTYNNIQYTPSHIDSTKIVGKIKIKDKGVKDSFNSITAKIADPAENFASRDITFFDSTYLKEDNYVPKEGNYACSGVTNYFNGRINVKQKLEQSRNSLSIDFNMLPEGLLLSAGDIVTLEHDRFGWVNKPFRIRTMTLKTDGLVSISATEHNDKDYLLGSTGTIFPDPDIIVNAEPDSIIEDVTEPQTGQAT